MHEVNRLLAARGTTRLPSGGLWRPGVRQVPTVGPLTSFARIANTREGSDPSGPAFSRAYSISSGVLVGAVTGAGAGAAPVADVPPL